MERSDTAHNTDKINPNRPGPSRTAEGVAAFRAVESMLPADERICYDPYAVRFISPARLSWLSAHPDDFFPGLANTIVARVRYFDGIVRAAAGDGLEQLIIMGAGYDSRAYRIEELVGKVRVFEIDHPDTQQIKKEKIREIFGSLPDHVIYVPVDFETQELGTRLQECGYSKIKTTLFVMEGLVMYLLPAAVDEMLSFITHNSGSGSAVLFDCSMEPESDVESGSEVRRNLREFTTRHGEPIKFAIPREGIDPFLARRGFSRVRTVTSSEYQRMYFHGKNKDRILYRSLSFIYAVIE